MKIMSSPGIYNADTCATFTVAYTAETLTSYAQKPNMMANSAVNFMLLKQSS